MVKRDILIIYYIGTTYIFSEVITSHIYNGNHPKPN